jgi:signal transduction histidine kinase/CheY-like chemotaxis protein
LLSFCDQAAIAIENARLYENAQKEIEDRKKAEEALQQANNLLEDRVEQRTSELRNANQQLTLELSRRIRAEKSLEDERVLLAKRVDERTAELSTANAQLARDARLKDAFIASMSHELRTPLNTILNISETLQEQVYGEINPAQLKSLRRIEDSGRHLLALINDILDLSKIGAGKLDLIWDYVAVEGLCRSSLQFIEEAAKKKNMQVLLELDPSVHYVWADQRRLKQILVNLLSNAVKFTPQDGKVTLSVHGDPDRKQMCFSVADTGIGIPPERMELLFKPFVQLDNSLARQYEGTGLGLAMVYSLIDLHGGGIRVISEEGKGSQFIVTLNWEDPDKGDRVRSSDSSVASKDPSAQKFTLVTNRISSVLRDYGLDLNTVWLDNQYTNRLASIAPEIIGLDLENIRDSALVINHVLQDTRTAKIPLVITGPAGQKDTIQNLPEHVVFVPSPFDLIELINAIRRISIRGTGGLNRRFALLRERIQPPNTNQLKILIADDNETSGRTLSDYLSSRGHQVTIAYNGMEAIDRTREIRPDLILMDIQMPGMDGLEAIRRIREDKNFSQVPIIAITALAMTDDRNRCLAAGATDYLSKPLSIKELNEFVESHITRKAD